MKTIVFLVGLCAAAVAYSASEQREVTPFRPGKEYTFRYNAQIAVGQSPEVSDQTAATRIQAVVRLNFESERRATLSMHDIRFGQVNHEIETPEHLQPMEMFEPKPMPEEHERLLHFPAQFTYTEGVIEQINFHADDKHWSKNVKRAVLNMLQINLKKNAQSELNIEAPRREANEDSLSLTTAFTIPEITIEGECATTYAINKASRWASEEEQKFNVTKTLDFNRCKKVVDVSYGFQTEDQQPQCFECNKLRLQQSEKFPQSPLCDRCDTKEVKEQKVERSSTFRFVLRGNAEKFGIERVEVLSQYAVKNLKAESEKALMQSVVTAELVFQTEQSAEKKQPRVSDTPESLLYSAQSDIDEKRFYMHGDEEFATNSPFKQFRNKVETVQKLLQKIVNDWKENTEGIEGESAHQLTRLVMVLRMSSIAELNEMSRLVREKFSDNEQHKAHQIFYDSLAIAGTRNTISVLVEKILSQEISASTAVQALKSLNGLIAPSKAQIELIQRLLKTEIAHRSSALKQSVWLTFGSMVGELCQQKMQNSETLFSTEELCKSHQKEQYKKIFLEQYKSSMSSYEKILALKAIGNAGLDVTVHDLEKIIHDQSVEEIVRIQAIDSLRRLRHQMPHKIQRVLLPLFQNTLERPEVRMAAFAIIMHTLPEQSVVRQITYTLINERSEQVKAFVYSTMLALSRSPAHVEQQLAQHLKSALQTVNFETQNLRWSRQFRVPIYSQQQQEGVFLNFASAFSTQNMLPSHISAGLDLMLNDEFDKDAVRVSFTQKDVERWYEQLAQQFLESVSAKTRGQRNERYGEEELRRIFSGLKIKSRREDMDSSDAEQKPFGMIAVRIGDIDHVIVPFDYENLPQSMQQLLKGEKLSLKSLLSAKKHFRINTVQIFSEKSAKIPTSAGLPLNFYQSQPALASLEGSLEKKESDRVDGPMGTNAHVSLHTTATLVKIQRLEILTPFIVSGVSYVRAFELNLPLNAEVGWEHGKGKVTVAWKVPQHAVRLFGAHTLPTAFITEVNQKTNMYQETHVKTIHNRELASRQSDFEHTYSEHSCNMPILVKGHVHMPSELSYTHILNVMRTTENHVHVHFVPNTDTPTHIETSVLAALFQEPEGVNRPEMEDFYSDSAKFSAAYPQDFEEMDSEDNEQRRSKLNAFIGQYQPSKMYKHSLKLSAKTVGSPREREAQLELLSVCDAKFSFCKTSIDAKRSPMHQQESAEWTLRAIIQTLLPQTVSEVSELSELSKKHQQFVGTFEAKWGSERQQSMNIRVRGEPAKTQQWRRIEDFESRHNAEYRKRTTFVNKYELTAEYKLNAQTQNRLNSVYEALKTYFYWNTRSEIQSEQNGRIHITALIDPITRQQMNVSVNSPMERVRMDSIELPWKMSPMQLIRDESASKHSVYDVISDATYGSGAECRVEQRRVRTFDGISYRASLSKCYSVLAKDCTRETPRFSVLMRQLSSDNAQKKLKVITREQTIEVEPKNEQLTVKINGDRLSRSELEKKPQSIVEYVSENEVIVRVQGVIVRFDGETAQVQLSKLYKNGQCGLCGHYDEEQNDELRMSGNELTDDLRAFHRSYSLQNDAECSEREQNDFYKNEKFQIESQESADEDNEDTFYAYGNGHERRQAKMQRNRDSFDEEESTEPIKKTKVEEYSHKVCFSEKPVKQCPAGYSAKDTKSVKMAMICVSRESSQTRRLLQQARRGDDLDLGEFSMSYTTTIHVPARCVSF